MELKMKRMPYLVRKYIIQKILSADGWQYIEEFVK